MQVIVLSSAIPGEPEIGEKGFSLLGGRPEETGDDANDPMDFLDIAAIEYTDMNVIEIDEDWDEEEDPLPEILKGVTSYNEYTWII